ncbi:MarR family winged helix-turn-helix transcriptional regulator [Demequina aurantiaca]|uniref:MarR family winged helix-turn-helix transcriptional regulator n=1 Tax=Demequina aurantiaca TaxID=676200 RepID=UPI003D34EA7B
MTATDASPDVASADLGAPRSRTRLANDAWEAMMTSHAHLMRRFAAEDIWGEVSMREYDVLYTLSKCDEPQRIGELGRHVLLSQPALSRLVERLATRGLVERSTDPSDARSVRIGLTEPGRVAQRTVGRAHAATVAATMRAAFTPAELSTLISLTSKLQEPSS